MRCGLLLRARRRCRTRPRYRARKIDTGRSSRRTIQPSHYEHPAITRQEYCGVTSSGNAHRARWRPSACPRVKEIRSGSWHLIGREATSDQHPAVSQKRPGILRLAATNCHVTGRGPLAGLRIEDLLEPEPRVLLWRVTSCDQNPAVK